MSKAKAAPWHKEKSEYEARLARLAELEAGVPGMRCELERLEAEAAEADRTGDDVDLSRIEAQRSRCNVRARSIEAQRAKVVEAKAAYDAAIRHHRNAERVAVEREGVEHGRVIREQVAKLAEALNGIAPLQARYAGLRDNPNMHIAEFVNIAGLSKLIEAVAGSNR